jgi:hypothetical protein
LEIKIWKLKFEIIDSPFAQVFGEIVDNKGMENKVIIENKIVANYYFILLREYS